VQLYNFDITYLNVCDMLFSPVIYGLLNAMVDLINHLDCVLYLVSLNYYYAFYANSMAFEVLSVLS
jgi:hypothetical protein